jgi:hypothetical protein
MGIESLAGNDWDPSFLQARKTWPLDDILLSAMTDDKVRDILRANITATIPMCEDCESFCTHMDSTHVRNLAYELGRCQRYCWFSV